MIPPLISIDLAKKHLRVTNNEHDDEIDAKIRLVTFIAMDHCKLTNVPGTWISDVEPVPNTESDNLILFTGDVDASPPDLTYIRVPGPVQAAMLLMLSDLFYNGDASTSNLLSDTVINLLTPFRDPTMA